MIQLSNVFKLFALQLLVCQFALADTVTLTPADINQEDTNTTQFSDGSLTLTPFIGDTPATFNANPGRLGVDDNGTNNNAFNDSDTDSGNDNDERLEFQFAADVGLRQISWDFSRADGEDGGVFISGFTSNPGATFEGNSNDYSSTIEYDELTGTLNFQITGGFDDFDGILVLANPQASAGQTLLLRVADLDQAGAQLVITGITYACNASSFADTVVVTAREINGEDTNTASFDDGSIALTPMIGDSLATFNENPNRLGVDGNGTNNNAFNDPDVDPANGNDERLEMALAGGVGLSMVGWDFSRADGEFGGVSISGFTADPVATFSGNAEGSVATYDALTGTLTFDVLGANFTSDDGYINFGNPSASQGQNLLLRVSDVDQAGAQLAITLVGYETTGSFLLGDINLDGIVSLLDVEPFVELITSGMFQAEGDINQDGFVDLLDVGPFVDILTGN